MDNAALLLIRFGGYLLTIFLLIVVILRYRQHAPLWGFVFFFAITALSILMRYLGQLDVYFMILDYGVTPLLYVNAVSVIWVLVRHKKMM